MSDNDYLHSTIIQHTTLFFENITVAILCPDHMKLYNLCFNHNYTQ